MTASAPSVSVWITFHPAGVAIDVAPKAAWMCASRISPTAAPVGTDTATEVALVVPLV